MNEVDTKRQRKKREERKKKEESNQYHRTCQDRQTNWCMLSHCLEPISARHFSHARPVSHQGNQAHRSDPIMVRARVGHFVEAQILEVIGVDYMDESEAVTLANEDNFINKHNFRCPFVSGCENLGEALSRVREGAAMTVEVVFCV